jgi:hypothetical protein
MLHSHHPTLFARRDGDHIAYCAGVYCTSADPSVVNIRRDKWEGAAA